MSIAIAVQKAIRARLVATPQVTALVPASSILDRNDLRPSRDPSIIVGEDQIVDEGRMARDVVRVYSTVHIWKREASPLVVKEISGAIRAAVGESRLGPLSGYHFGDSYVSSERFLRDPDGATSHGVVTIETLVGVD